MWLLIAMAVSLFLHYITLNLIIHLRVRIVDYHNVIDIRVWVNHAKAILKSEFAQSQQKDSVSVEAARCPEVIFNFCILYTVLLALALLADRYPARIVAVAASCRQSLK